MAITDTPDAPTVPVVLVGRASPLRSHVSSILRKHHPLTESDEPTHAAQLCALHIAAHALQPAVVVILAPDLDAGRTAVAGFAAGTPDGVHPVVLVVEDPQPPEDLDDLPDVLLRGRHDRAELLMAVRSACRLAEARGKNLALYQRMDQQQHTADKLQHRMEVERSALTTMARYLSPVVLTHIQDGRAQLPPYRQRLSVLFSDIRGFTDASGFSEPEELVELLGEYLHEVNRIVTTLGGNLDKFMGDGILAYFTPQDDSLPHALRAVMAATGLLERLEELKVQWFERGFLPVGVGVGVSTGEAIMGTIGVGQRLDHTVIGPTVNLAARLQGVARGGQVVVDEATRLAAGQHLRLGDARHVSVKGFEEPVLVHVVQGLRGEDHGSQEP